MQVVSPSKNAINGPYTSSHKGYDHDDVPDKRYYASVDGKVTHVTNTFTTSWIANDKNSDPYYTNGNRPLRTEDFGNFFKILGDNGITQLAAHFPKDGILVKVGQRVKAGELVAIPPGNHNDTGNSTGGHTHTEYRNAQGANIEVTFIAGVPMPETIVVEKKDWDRLFRASQLGDLLINKIGMTGNIADKSEIEMNALAVTIINERDARKSCEESKEAAIKKAREEGYAQGLAQSGSNPTGPQTPEGFAVERIAVEEQIPAGKRTTTYIPKN